MTLGTISGKLWNTKVSHDKIKKERLQLPIYHVQSHWVKFTFDQIDSVSGDRKLFIGNNWCW